MLLHAVEERPEREHLGTAEFVDRAGLARAFTDIRDRRRHVADVHGLETGPPADQGQHGRGTCHGGEPIEQAVLGPEHERRTENDGLGKGFENRSLTLGLGAPVLARRCRTGADRRDVHEATGSGLARTSGHGPRPADMN